MGYSPQIHVLESPIQITPAPCEIALEVPLPAPTDVSHSNFDDHPDHLRKFFLSTSFVNQ
ncbi:unnamed protein product, partial [Ilex paraguariensis]